MYFIWFLFVSNRRSLRILDNQAMYFSCFSSKVHKSDGKLLRFNVFLKVQKHGWNFGSNLHVVLFCLKITMSIPE